MSSGHDEYTELLLAHIAASWRPTRARAVLCFIDLAEDSNKRPTLADVAREFEGDFSERVVRRQEMFARAFDEAFGELTVGWH